MVDIVDFAIKVSGFLPAFRKRQLGAGHVSLVSTYRAPVCAESYRREARITHHRHYQQEQHQVPKRSTGAPPLGLGHRLVKDSFFPHNNSKNSPKAPARGWVGMFHAAALVKQIMLVLSSRRVHKAFTPSDFCMTKRRFFNFYETRRELVGGLVQTFRVESDYPRSTKSGRRCCFFCCHSSTANSEPVPTSQISL